MADVRLIDAVAYYKELKEEMDYPGRSEEFMIAIDVAIADLADAPTVEAVPVVHGRWVAVPSSDMMTGKAYKCSECQKMRYGSFMPNYCQNCGAKMDLEV